MHETIGRDETSLSRGGGGSEERPGVGNPNYRRPAVSRKRNLVDLYNNTIVNNTILSSTSQYSSSEDSIIHDYQYQLSAALENNKKPLSSLPDISASLRKEKALAYYPNDDSISVIMRSLMVDDTGETLVSLPKPPSESFPSLYASPWVSSLP